jgi:multidrug efflux pump subunit AcrB
MKSFFSLLTNLSVRFRVVTLALVIAVIVLGVVAITQLKQELLPPIEFPQTIILGQVSGLTSEQVMEVLTKPLEIELDKIDELVNIQSTTTGAFGSVIQTSNEFGQNQERLRQRIQDAINRVWLPLRRIAPAADQDAQAFASTLLADMTPDVLIYLAEADPNFLFQLSPDIWAAFPADTTRAVLAYLAAQTEASEADKSALRQLVDQEIVPQLDALDLVANVTVGGGQVLPGEESALAISDPAAENAQPSSLLLKLSREVWAVVGGDLGALDASAVESLRSVTYEIPETVPPLPASWQMDRFVDATDLVEMRTLTRTTAGVFNNFYTSGSIVGSLGQTNDLTPEVVEQMLAIDPTMAGYFEAEQLAAMSPEVFAVLPSDFVANLDGFTRDALAAAALAQSITGERLDPEPVELPSAWRISPPQIISFSFDDLPLATFSVFGNLSTEQAAPQEEAASETVAQAEATPEATPEADTTVRDIPEGPPLPLTFNLLLGSFLGTELNTADDLIDMPVSGQIGEQLGASTLRAADFFNFLILLSDPESLPPGAPTLPIDVSTLISGLSPEAIGFIADNDPTFIPNLSADVYERFSDGVLQLPQLNPPLADVWDTLAGQPQFTENPLDSAKDLLEIGGGSASSVLNTIDETVPEDFSGYEVRLFDSLTPGVVRYLALNEPDFYSNLNPAVLEKLSPQVLALLSPDFLASLDPAVSEKLTAIANGEQDSAATVLEARYTTNAPLADPNAPAINSEWVVIEQFFNVELDSADDFFRFPEGFQFSGASDMMNGLFATPQGASFASGMIGGMSADAINYMLTRDPAVFNDLQPDPLQAFAPEILALLPQELQDRAKSGGEPFKPTDAVTRTNGASSLLVTVFKSRASNTVEAFHTVEAVIHAIDEANEDIQVDVAFEQASFVEESISGVAREGLLGAIFAIIVILLFLSDGVWNRSPRRTVGLVMVAIFAIGLILVVVSGLNAANGDVGLAFAQADTVVRVLLIIGVVSGLIILLWPGNIPNPAWRSTLVTTVSIPLSILAGLAMMNWLIPAIHNLLAPAAETSSIIAFVLRLFPARLTLNLMTLSGMTVAIGRVVDDSIVVLENIFREMQAGKPKREAILSGTRDVSVAIFSATVVTVVVFLPLGLTGGLISEFFLPFGLTVTYALLASFIVAITVVPALAYTFVNEHDIAEEEGAGPIAGQVAKVYQPILNWSLASSRNRFIVLGVAALSLALSGALFGTRPFAFLPDFGEPQIAVNVSLPSGTKIIETNALVSQMEQVIRDTFPPDELGTVRANIGGGGLSLEALLGTTSISENAAQITVGLQSQENIDARTQELRAQAEAVFGADNVTVSAASLSDGGFGGFELVVAGPQEELEALDSSVIETLENVDGLANVSSNLSQVTVGGDSGPTTYLRINLQSALSYRGELETQDTIGTTQIAKRAVELMDLPADVTVSEGFQTQTQTQGFQGILTAMLIAIGIVVIVLIVTFGSLVHWLDIILSIIVAPVGAAIALTLADESLGISAMIGMLMLIGIVVTNAVVLIDRVQQNRHERGLGIDESLKEAGARRLRPILMTTIATIIALVPLAVGLSEGAIIAAQLGVVVIGGITSSMLLTLIVVPVAYRLLDPLNQRIARVFGRKG